MSTMMKDEEIKSAYIEGVLFSAAKPISLDMLADIFSCSLDDIKEKVQVLSEELIAADRGLRIRISGAGVELISASACHKYINKIRKKEDTLSSAAVETLAIVAFKQPVTKAYIEEIRGVNSEKVIKQLVSRQLITELGHKDTIGRPILYGTTDEFLRSVGISSLDDLQEEMAEIVTAHTKDT